MPYFSFQRNRCLQCFGLISAVFIAAGVLVGYELRVRNFQAVDIDNTNSSLPRTVSLQTELISIDPMASNAVINWYILSDSCSNNISALDTCTPVSMFFDTNLLRLDGGNSQQNLTNDIPDVPIFTWRPRDLSESEVSNTPWFKTSLALYSGMGGDYGSVNFKNPQNYPFDIYNSLFFLFANDTVTHQTVNVQITSTFGVATGFKTVATSDDDYGDGYIFQVLTFERSPLVKAYVLIIIIGVWLITLIFVGSVMKVMFGYKQPKEALAIPIATLFAITSLRGSMPGAPAGFGAIIDFVGILPCLAVITLTGVFLFGYLVLSNSEITATEPSIGIPFFKNKHNDISRLETGQD